MPREMETPPAGLSDAQVAALVASRVLGWRLCDRPANADPDDHCSLYGEAHFAPDADEVLALTKDIAAAWPVLEKLRADGKIDMASVSVGEHGWWCVLYPPLGHGQLSVESDYCDTAAEAICCAALAATEGHHE